MKPIHILQHLAGDGPADLAGTRLLAATAACPVQAFSVRPHLTMQWHVELDEVKLARWSLAEGEERRQTRLDHPTTVQTGPALREAAAVLLPQQQGLANHIDGRGLGVMSRGFAQAHRCAWGFHITAVDFHDVVFDALHRSKNSPYGRT